MLAVLEGNFIIIGTKDEKVASVECGVVLINWGAIEKLAASQNEGAPQRTTSIAQLLIAVRDQAWKPLLLPCPRNDTSR